MSNSIKRKRGALKPLRCKTRPLNLLHDYNTPTKHTQMEQTEAMCQETLVLIQGLGNIYEYHTLLQY